MLHHLAHKISHGFRSLILHLPGGVGVGAEGEPGVVVPQHTGYRFDVHAILQRQGGEGVTQGVEGDVLQSGIPEDLLVELHHRIRVIHLACGAGREHIGAVRVPLVLLDQQIHRFLRDGYPSHRGLGLGTGEGELPAGVLDVLLADRDRPVLEIQVIPEEGHQLAFPQTAHQLQVEHGENVPCVGGVQVGLQVLRPEGFHLYLLHFGSDTVIGGVPGDEPLFHRPLKRAVEHQVDATDSGAAQTGIPVAASLVHPAMLHQVFVELLEIPGGQLFQLDLPNPRDGVGFDHQLVAVRCGLPDVGQGVEVVPGAEPGGHGVLVGVGDIHLLGLFHSRLELFFGFSLGAAQDVFDDALAGVGIVARGVSALPAAVRTLP